MSQVLEQDAALEASKRECERLRKQRSPSPNIGLSDSCI